ncbi:MAG: hypothetical protein OHK0046_13360 [Anaerolineae bacterium]
MMTNLQRSRHLLAFGFYLLLAVLITWPLVTVFSTHLFGGFLTDAYQTARHVWWIKHALQTGQSVFYQTTLGYPDGLNGAWLWANPFEYFPGWLFAFVMPLNAAVNLMLLVHLALNGWAMYRLVTHLTGLVPVGLLAGIIFMTYPAMHGRIYGGHVGVLALWPLPLALLMFVHLRETRKPVFFGLAALFLALSVAGNSTLLVYYVAPVMLVFLAALLFTRQWVWLRRSVIAAALGGALALVLLLPLLLSPRPYSIDVTQSVQYSADLLAVISPSFFHPLFDSFEFNRRVLGVNLVEGIGYVGLLTTLLALVGVVRVPAARRWFWLALVVWIASLGPLLKVLDQPVMTSIDFRESTITLPWVFFQKLPVIEMSRTPGRFNLTLGLAVAILAGYGAASLWQWRRAVPRRVPVWRWLALMAVAVLIIAENQVFWGMPTVDARVPQAVSDLQARDDIRAVFTIPYDHRILIKRGLMLQAYHQQNILDGQFIRDTPVNPAKLGLLQATLDPALLDSAGVDVVIWHKEFSEQATALNLRTREQLGAPFYEDETLALFNVPEASSAPQFTTDLTSTRTLTRDMTAAFYMPESGWVRLSGQVNGEVEVFVDDARYNTISGAVDLLLPVESVDFHRLRFALNPPCPQVESPALFCRTVEMTAMTLTFEAPQTFTAPAAFAEFTLRGAYWEAPGETLQPHLWWDFAQPPPENASRFIHIIGANGELVAQADGPLPVTMPDTQWVDSPVIDLPDDLSAGEYRVYTGWYLVPTLERIPVEGAENQQVLLGTFEINGPP